MIEHIVQEIHKCLENDCQIAALGMALTLPDACAKVWLPEESGNRKRYVSWYDQFVVAPQKAMWGENANGDMFLSGDAVYKLRCALLHESDPTVSGTSECITDFSLIWKSVQSASRTPIERCKRMDGDFHSVEVDIVSLCDQICSSVLQFYYENKVKFDFHYRIVSATDRTARCFGFDNVMKI